MHALKILNSNTIPANILFERQYWNVASAI